MLSQLSLTFSCAGTTGQSRHLSASVFPSVKWESNTCLPTSQGCCEDSFVIFFFSVQSFRVLKTAKCEVRLAADLSSMWGRHHRCKLGSLLLQSKCRWAG